MVVSDTTGETYDHGKDIVEFHRLCEDFKNSLNIDMERRQDYNVTTVSKVSAMHIDM